MRSEMYCCLILGSLLGACVTDDAVSSTTQAATTKNKLASNKLASNKLASNKLASNMLSSGEILSTPDGRTVYSYIVSCAIETGTTIEAVIPGAADTAPPADPFTCLNGVCDFPGGLGLAPSWLRHKLTPEGRGWISACMFARVNAHDTAEEISLHGEHPALTVAVDEAALYTVEEGGFYGDMFTPEDEPIAWYACRGEGQASGEFGGLVDRDCAEPDPANPLITQCGFNYAGDCGDYTPQYPSPYACDERESGDPEDHGNVHGHHHDNAAEHGFYYEGCHATSNTAVTSKHGVWHHSAAFRQVVTTFVIP